jgi:hypothetical protein
MAQNVSASTANFDIPLSPMICRLEHIRCVPGAPMRNPYQNKCKGLTVSELLLNTFLHGEL